MPPCRIAPVSPLFLFCLVLLATPAFAQDTAAVPAEIGPLLGKLLLVLILLESAMTALFNWRVYRIVLAGRAWKTPIMFGLGLLVVFGFGFDPVRDALIAIAGGSVAAGFEWLSPLLSALVFAGGSQGIFDLFRKLGLRAPLAEGDDRPPLREDQAWLALRIRRVHAVGEIQVILAENPGGTAPSLVGSIDDRPLGRRLAEAFGLGGLRFPRTGGQLVKPETTYDLALRFDTADRTGVVQTVGSLRLAPRAIVDLDVTA